MRTEEVTEGSRLSAATRFESLVGVSNAIGMYRDPQELFGALLSELHRVVRFDYGGEKDLIFRHEWKNPYKKNGRIGATPLTTHQKISSGSHKFPSHFENPRAI